MLNAPISRIVLYQKLFACFVGLAFVIFVTISVIRDHGAAEAEERNRLLTQAHVIKANLEEQLRATDSALLGVIADLPNWRTANGWAPGFERRLKGLDSAMPGIRTFVFVDDRCIIGASNRSELVGMDVSNREYYKTARQNADIRRLYMSQPFNTALNVFAVTVSRVVEDAQGNFVGLLTATLDPAFFRTLLASVIYAPDMRATVVHWDGLLMFTVPEEGGQIGKNLALPGTFFTRHRDSGKAETIYSGTVYATGQESLMAQCTIQPLGSSLDKPLVVAVSRLSAAVFAQWFQQVVTEGTILLVVILMAALLIHRYHTQLLLVGERELKAQAELQRLATTDPLTGCANRRQFEERLAIEALRAKRFGGVISVLMVDLDHFKKVNDTYGHQVGDQVLKAFVTLVAKRLREVDLLGRLGGEEFAILLPGTEKTGAKDVAEELRTLVTQSRIPTANGQPVTFTISVGVAAASGAEADSVTLLAQADASLYQAKRSGRNRVVCAASDVEVSLH